MRNDEPLVNATPVLEDNLLQLTMIFPVYREERNIEPLYEKMCTVKDQLGNAWKLLFINDVSQDGLAFCSTRFWNATPV